VETSVNAKLGQIESGRFGLAAELAVNIPTLEVAQDLTEQAHQVCPYSTLHVVTWSKIICNQQLKKKKHKMKK
jgi:organic hydroperoxide reductase OsmC/OhrA